MSQRRLRVLFRAAGGPRRGFGHIVRAVRLAKALGVPALISVRGAATACGAVRTLGGIPVEAALLRPGAQHFDVIVVDDPSVPAARSAIARARRAGVLSISIHDLGIGCHDADHLIDGSIDRPGQELPTGRALAGPRFAILDPDLRSLRTSDVCHETPPSVLIALGGGQHTALATRLARALTLRVGGLDVSVAGGFSSPARCPTSSLIGSPRHGGGRIRLLGPQRTLAPTLARAAVAIVGGGVTLFEAAALGVPAIAVAVVEDQRPTIEGFARARAAVDGGRLFGVHAARAAIDGLSDAVEDLLKDERRRRELATRARRLVDGRGAERVSRAIRRWHRQHEAHRASIGERRRAA
jgi:spore coat polysaccharide biosynthesis predicted glycosyltransferase SpsG